MKKALEEILQELAAKLAELGCDNIIFFFHFLSTEAGNDREH